MHWSSFLQMVQGEDPLNCLLLLYSLEGMALSTTFLRVPGAHTNERSQLTWLDKFTTTPHLAEYVLCACWVHTGHPEMYKQQSRNSGLWTQKSGSGPGSSMRVHDPNTSCHLPVDLRKTFCHCLLQ